MTALTPLLERNADYAAHRHQLTPTPQPRFPLVVVTCLDPRTDPAAFLGVEAGDLPVFRNPGGRITPGMLDDLAFIAQLGAALGAGGGAEIAVIHHTMCGTGFLADDAFRHSVTAATGVDDGYLRGLVVTDPEATVRADVELLRRSGRFPAEATFSGHVLDLESGRVRTVVDVADHGAVAR